MSYGYSMGFAEGTDVPIDHLDYGYIRRCGDGGELEKILKTLRSGREGTYPDLIKTAEEKLREVKPNSKLLIKPQNITRITDLPSDEWKELSTDIQQWEKIISREDDALSSDGLKQEKEIISHEDTDLPPVRKAGTITAKSADKQSAPKKKQDGARPTNPDRIKSYDFSSWDKFDVNEEVKKVEEEEVNEKKEESKKKPGVSNWNDELTEQELAMSEAKRQRAAQREREKGNEAFKAGDHEESIAYYTRSIKLFPEAAAFNNRALAHIKLEQHEQAVSDCNQTLTREPNNTKALLRKATAHKALKDYKEAVDLCERLLKLEPNNKRGQDLLTKVREVYVPDVTHHDTTNRRQKGRRITIQEVDKQIDNDTLEEALHQETTNTGNGKTEDFVCSTMGEAGSKTEQGPVKPPTPPPPVVATPLPPPPLPTNVQFLKDEGNKLFRVGQYGAAVKKYSKALEVLEAEQGDHSQSLATLFSNRAACHLKNGDCHSCISDASRSISLCPLNLKAITRRAAAYETMEKYRHAFVDYQLALRIDSKFDKAQEASSRITRILRDQDGNGWRNKLPPNPDQDRVLTALYSSRPPITSSAPLPEAAAGMKPVDPKTGSNAPLLSPSSLSVTSTKSQNTPHSPTVTQATPTSSNTRKTDELLKADQECFEEFKKKGNDLVKKGQYQSALQSYTSCISLCPDQAVAYTNRALCLLKLNRFSDCEKDCSTALDLDDKNVKALYRRALARKGLDRLQESLKDLKCVIELDQSNSAAKKESDIVHDMYLEELRKIQANQPLSKEPKGGSKKAQSSKGTHHSPRRTATTDPKTKDNKRKTSPKPDTLPNAAVDSVSRCVGQDVSGEDTKSEFTDEVREKKRKKVLIEEVSDDKEPESVEGEEKKGVNRETEEARVTQERVNLQEIKPEKGNLGHLIQLWNSVPRSAPPLQFAELLLKIDPALLKQVISNKLEGHTLTNIIAAIDLHLIPEGFLDFSYNVLCVLPGVSRFSVIKMFLSAKDKEVLIRVFKSLEASSIKGEELRVLKEKYSL